MIIQIVILVILIFLNAFFAASEMAFVSLNDAKIEKKYLISEHIETGKIVYHTLSKKCAEYIGISRSCILKRPNASKENPYISPKQPNFKIYFSSEFIPYTKDTVLDGEPPILLSGKIEESPEMDNIELTN